MKALKRIKMFILLLVVIICSCFYTKVIRAEENKIIRVGFPTVSGFTEKKDGVYTGYAYEYLREIAIYTGWEYEFVEKSLSDLMDDLKDGKIDILAGMLKNDNTMEIYDYPEYNSGNTYTTLSVLSDSNIFDESKYILLDGITVGCFETAKKSINEFLNFCDENNIKNVNIVTYPYENNRKDLVDKMKSGEVDAILGGDLVLGSEEKVIAKFGGNPQYFATTKGNTEIINGLNSAIYKIKEQNPQFDENIYNKYFKNSNNSYLIFTSEEAEYVKDTPIVRAAYIDNYVPIQYYDENTKEASGIFVGIMNLIEQKANIKFDFVRAKSYEEAYEMIKDDKVDVIIGAINDYTIADKNDFILTKAYLNFELLKVVNKEESISKEKPIIALPIGHGYINLKGDYEIKYYDTIEECLTAVNNGRADITYGNSYSISNYIAVGYYNNLTIISNGDTTEVAIGISERLDGNITNILHKTVYSLSDSDIENVIQKNTLNIKHSISIRQLFYENLGIFMIIILIITILIYIIIKMRFDKIKEAKKRLYEKTQIDSLTGIYNREACEQLVTNYLEEKEYFSYYAFIIIDIDCFKQVNDRFGHKIGDNLLIEFSELLRKSFSENDVISRLGGDEFIIFVRDINEEDKKNIEEQLKALCKAMEKEVVFNDLKQKISISLGCIVARENISFNKLYVMADEALYEAKNSGKNGYKIKEIKNN